MKRAILFLGLVLLLSSCATFQKWVNPVPVSKLVQGQTVAEVREFCRFPDTINTTVVNGAKHEQWVYRNPGMHINSDVYLYFENGALVAWQY